VLPMPGGHYSHLRLQPAGGIAQLGAPAPAIRVGARATSLVFLARGAAPYRLAWGQTAPDTAAPARLSLAELMPGRQAGDALPGISARMAASPAPVAAAAAPAASAQAPSVPSRKLWLWGVLVAALALLGAMAWTLLRPASDRP